MRCANIILHMPNDTKMDGDTLKMFFIFSNLFFQKKEQFYFFYVKLSLSRDKQETN